MAHNGSGRGFGSQWRDQDEWSMEPEEMFLRGRFMKPSMKGELLMYEKVIHKDFYNDFGDIFEKENATTHSK